jgi:hypothetical protein
MSEMPSSQRNWRMEDLIRHMAARSPCGRDRRGTRATPREFLAIPAAGRDISRTMAIRVNIRFPGAPRQRRNALRIPPAGMPSKRQIVKVQLSTHEIRHE